MITPLSIVIPANAGIHEHGGSKSDYCRVHGFRIKSGMTSSLNPHKKGSEPYRLRKVRREEPLGAKNGTS